MVLEKAHYNQVECLLSYTLPFKEGSAFILMKHVTAGLLRLHNIEIVHLDIKESNLLVFFDREAQFNIDNAYLPIRFKISDLGISQDLS